MDFFDVIAKRHSIRVFKDKGIEEEKIKKILETANCAPSAGDLQAYEIYLVKKKEAKQKLASAALGQTFIAEAAIDLVFFAHPARSSVKYGKRGHELYCVQDATIAAAYAQLAAVALGLGCAWAGAFNDSEVRKVLSAPDELRPVAIIPIGYAAERPYPTPRRKLKDIVHEV